MPSGSATHRLFDHIDDVALLGEILGPSLTPIRRAHPVGRRLPGAVDQHERIGSALILWSYNLDISLTLHDLLAGFADVFSANIEIATLPDHRLIDGLALAAWAVPRMLALPLGIAANRMRGVKGFSWRPPRYWHGNFRILTMIERDNLNLAQQQAGCAAQHFGPPDFRNGSWLCEVKLGRPRSTARTSASANCGHSCRIGRGCVVPRADICSAANCSLFDYLVGAARSAGGTVRPGAPGSIRFYACKLKHPGPFIDFL